MADMVDSEGKKPIDVASVELVPLLDPERLAALTVLTTGAAAAKLKVGRAPARLGGGAARQRRLV
jgi:hypothetical protein